MTLFTRLQRWLGAAPHEPDAESLAREEALRAKLRERCQCFRHLLSSNKLALEAMSDIEVWLAAAQPYGMERVSALGERVTVAVADMVRDLNALSENAYAPLQTAYTRINEALQAVLQPQVRPRGPLVLPLLAVGHDDIPQVGVKMANLGEVAAHVGLNVPDGFAITVSAYDRFMEYKGLRERLEQRIQATDMDNLDALFGLSTDLQRAVLAAPLPPDLEQAITDAVHALRQRSAADLTLALRSSAVGEDGPEMSFAGQYRSELHVPLDEACQVYKEIVASKYSVTALSYRRIHGVPDDEAPMCVGVLAMVPSAAGGVVYSLDPVAVAQGQRQVLLNAVRGLAKGVVDGAITPDVYAFTRRRPPHLLHKTSSAAPSGLTDAQAAELAAVALALEEYYTTPQDVEWALDSRTGQLVILQSRPLQAVATATEQASAPTPPSETEESLAAQESDITSGDDLPVLAAGGMAVSPGVGMGKAVVLRKEADMLSFPKGGILVVERALPRWAPLLPHAAGIISESGGMAGHLASVAREYHLPALFGLAGACTLLHDAGDITLDARHARVLAGCQAQLAEQGQPPDSIRHSPVHKRLAALARLVVPLHLLDPEGADFTPEHCRTLHDITRFCHEKSVEHLFTTDPLSRRMGKQLKAGVKLQYWLIDVGGGFRHEVRGPVVDINEIACTPLLALWDGMTAIPWSGPPAANASGFMAVMLQSTMNPDLEVTAPNTMAEKNFFLVSDSYMLLQARYGYHFCTVESAAGANSHENFVSFQFKGGAADRTRRQLRARMVADLLEARGFRAEVGADGFFAVAEDFPPEDILLKTRLVGYLLIHTRQVDMIMLDKERADALRRKLEADLEAMTHRPLSPHDHE